VRALLPHLADGGYVVSAQNGLNELEIAAVVGAARTVGAFVNFGADYLEPGVIHCGGRGAVVVGEIDGQITSRATAIRDAWRALEPRAIVTPNIWGYLWGKEAYGAMLFATALTNESIADALALPAYRPLYIALAKWGLLNTRLGLILIYGTVDMTAIVQQQSGLLLGFLPAWGIFLQPFAAVLFITAAMAENRRIPFDLPEAESELIAGYFTEYSAMKMGLFMFAEFIEIAVIAAIFTTLFLGGYNLPYMDDSGFKLPGGIQIAMSHGAVIITQMVVFLLKVLFMSSFQILVRWSLPRFRYDQLLRFAWKFLFPLCLANLVVTAVAVWLLGGMA